MAHHAVLQSFGHRDFVLCLGYKAGVIKEYFLNYKQTVATDCVTVSKFGSKVEIVGERPPDWRVTLIDTGIWRNIGGRLLAVKHLVEKEEILPGQLQRWPHRRATVRDGR